MLDDPHAAHVQIGVLEALGQVGDCAGLVLNADQKCVLGNGVPTGIAQDAQGSVVLVHPEHHQANVVDFLCVK